jgi:hypothetical protein
MLPTAYFAIHSAILYILRPIKAKPEVTNAHHLSR